MVFSEDDCPKEESLSLQPLPSPASRSDRLLVTSTRRVEVEEPNLQPLISPASLSNRLLVPSLRSIPDELSESISEAGSPQEGMTSQQSLADSASASTGLPSANSIQAEDPGTSNAEEDLFDTGSFDSDGSTSLNPSMRGHTYEDGLRYHKYHDGQYPVSNDENAQNRDDMKHAMVLLLCNQKLHFAPIGDRPQRILDLGTRLS